MKITTANYNYLLNVLEDVSAIPPYSLLFYNHRKIWSSQTIYRRSGTVPTSTHTVYPIVSTQCSTWWVDDIGETGRFIRHSNLSSKQNIRPIRHQKQNSQWCGIITPGGPQVKSIVSSLEYTQLSHRGLIYFANDLSTVSQFQLDIFKLTHNFGFSYWLLWLVIALYLLFIIKQSLNSLTSHYKYDELSGTQRTGTLTTNVSTEFKDYQVHGPDWWTALYIFMFPTSSVVGWITITPIKCSNLYFTC